MSCQFYVTNFISYSNYNNINLHFGDAAFLLTKACKINLYKF